MILHSLKCSTFSMRNSSKPVRSLLSSTTTVVRVSAACAHSTSTVRPMARQSVAPPRVSSKIGEHTSELQSRQYLVCRLLLEKKNNKRFTLHTRLSSADECHCLAMGWR